MARRRVALATYARVPGLASDDLGIVPALAACGLDAEGVVWSDEVAEWGAFDAVVLRSCWDYHLQVDSFHRWIARLEAAGVRVLNSPALVRWNSNKRYLLDLAQWGVATIPTMIVPAGHAAHVEHMAAAEGWDRFVIKPAVSASGYETYAVRMPLDAAARECVTRATSVGDALLQPFVQEVPRDGEYSFTFIDGAFSHATLKRASGGEFRVQTEHGGSVESVTAPAALINQAAAVLAALPETPLYARVDGVARHDAFLLMELELIEPNLFFGFSPGSVDVFARAIANRLA
jgi:glutathione synthase/RimK-type ligase-like ATP-grasp enzyme